VCQTLGTRFERGEQTKATQKTEGVDLTERRTYGIELKPNFEGGGAGPRALKNGPSGHLKGNLNIKWPEVVSRDRDRWGKVPRGKEGKKMSRHL